MHSEACNALGASDGVIHNMISLEAACLQAASSNLSAMLTGVVVGHLVALLLRRFRTTSVLLKLAGFILVRRLHGAYSDQWHTFSAFRL